MPKELARGTKALLLLERLLSLTQHHVDIWPPSIRREWQVIADTTASMRDEEERELLATVAS